MLGGRAKRLVGGLPQNFEGALLSTRTSVFYLLDFDFEGAGTLVLLPDEMVFIIDSRYIEVAQKNVQGVRLVLEEDALAQTQDLLQEKGARTLYVENAITVKRLAHLKEKLQNVEIISDSTLSDELDKMRAIKDTEEVRRMREAQKITDACFAHILSFIKVGMREVDIMLEMERYMRSHGAEKVAFDTICVAGPNTSMPHGVPGEYEVQQGDFITLDFGAKYKGYCSDMTRTIAVGEPGEEQRKVYDLVLQAHLAGIATARPGVLGRDVDKVARDMIYGAGYEGYFGHGLGHSLGIEIHEDPRFAPKNTTEIREGMMMTVEPGVYLPGRFGCRIEDMVLITAEGCEPLPKSPKELIVL